jgi:hypothetical protein
VPPLAQVRDKEVRCISSALPETIVFNGFRGR